MLQNSVNQYKQDWEGIIFACGFTRCRSCGVSSNETKIIFHHKEPVGSKHPRFLYNKPVTIDRLYELVVECEPLCDSCHRLLHRDFDSCDDEKIKSTRFQRQIDFTPELNGELAWPEMEQGEESNWDTVDVVR